MTSLRRFEFDQLTPELANLLAPRVKRLGYLGEFFKCTAHQPAALSAFIEFTEAGKGSLPNNLVEVIALTCAGWMGNAYERNQHERLCLELGLGKDWVREINLLQPESASGLSLIERQVQRLVLVVLETKGVRAQSLVEETLRLIGEAETIAILMIIGRYVVHALIVNSLGLAPPVPSIFEASDS
jgi:hypothetical protein